ncbi:hypothetical protein LS74_010235 [Helicobacter magdeburgensis]|uniref:Uncharacterized protein n=1 Tax=Helicobacter magdeburgensis TaxID=471858 RepID=A0A4U8SY17_9HELI|nr:hypothetical protein [Helicobacter magdeburgensis]TLD91117.1 hypothetical protein LS74_010235 [Helicobacter magdeburgensis]
MSKIKKPNSDSIITNRLRDTHSGRCVVSLEKVIECDKHGLCLGKNHSFYREQNAKKYNTKLMKLFLFLTQRSWSEIIGQRKNVEYGHEHLDISCFRNIAVKNSFENLGKKHANVFRFGGQDFRACGYREGDTFYLVCIDYNFSLYKHS